MTWFLILMMISMILMMKQLKPSSCRTIIKRIFAYSIYQMMIDAATDSKNKTLLHVMMGQSFYSQCHSHSTIISLNKIGVSTSYDDVWRGRALLASYTITKTQDKLTPISSHFWTGPGAGFVSGAFDNMNMKDRSSTCCLSGCW